MVVVIAILAGLADAHSASRVASSEARPSSTSSRARTMFRYVSDQADKRGSKNNQTAVDERFISDDDRMQKTVVRDFNARAHGPAAVWQGDRQSQNALPDARIGSAREGGLPRQDGDVGSGPKSRPNATIQRSANGFTTRRKSGQRAHETNTTTRAIRTSSDGVLPGRGDGTACWAMILITILGIAIAAIRWESRRGIRLRVEPDGCVQCDSIPDGEPPVDAPPGADEELKAWHPKGNS